MGRPRSSAPFWILLSALVLTSALFLALAPAEHAQRTLQLLAAATLGGWGLLLLACARSRDARLVAAVALAAHVGAAVGVLVVVSTWEGTAPAGQLALLALAAPLMGGLVTGAAAGSVAGAAVGAALGVAGVAVSGLVKGVRHRRA